MDLPEKKKQMAAQKDTKSCPNCRKTVPRLLEHLRPCAFDKSPEQHNFMNINETERIKVVGMQSAELDHLKHEYPYSYWDVANCLIKMQIPVYQKTEKRNGMRTKDPIVKHLTLSDIPKRSGGVGRPKLKELERKIRKTSRKSMVRPLDISNASNDSVQSPQEKRERPILSDDGDAEIDVQPDILEGNVLHSEADEDFQNNAVRYSVFRGKNNPPISPKPKADRPKRKNRRKSQSGEARRKSMDSSLDTSNASEDNVQPSQRKRLRTVLSDDEDTAIGDKTDTFEEDISAEHSEDENEGDDSDISKNESDILDISEGKAVVEHSEEEDEEADDGNNIRRKRKDVSQKSKENSKKRKDITSAYRDLQIFLDKTELEHHRCNNRYAELIENYLDSKKLERKHHDGSKNPVKAYMSTVLKIMKYLSPENKIETFRWRNACDVHLIEKLYLDLQRRVQLGRKSIANWFKAILAILETASCDVSFKLNDPEHAAHLDTVKNKTKSLQKKNNNAITQEKAEQKALEAYTGIEKYEEQFVELFQTFERVHAAVSSLVRKAEQERVKMTTGDLCTINGYFSLYSMLIGNRPGVIQHMEKTVFDMADRHQQTREDGSSYYFLATASHKTSTTHVAYIYMEEEYWTLMRIYRNNIRVATTHKKHDDFLFLNSEGKQLQCPSTGIARLLGKYGSFQISSNEYRHCLETLAARYMTTGQRTTIHKMLTHSATTATKHYVHEQNRSVPHRAGIPLLQQMLQKCSENRNMDVRSFLGRSEDLLIGISPSQLKEVESQGDLEGTQQTDTTIHPPSVKSTTNRQNNHHRSATTTIESSIAETAKKGSLSEADGMKILLDSMDEMTAHSTIPLASEYREAVQRHPELGLGTDRASIKRFNDMCRHVLQKLRTDAVVEHFKRASLKEESKIQESVRRFLDSKDWFTSKLIVKCVYKVKEAMAKKTLSARNEVHNNRLVIKDGIDEQIDSQIWPLLKVLKAGKKGLGIFAAQHIHANTLLCDYHGELLDEEEGWHRYDVDYSNNPKNVYMYHFQYGPRKMWIDAVKQCECHPGTVVKGRLMNHEKTNPNVYTKVQVVGGRPHILMFAKSDISKGVELQFDYGSEKDKYSFPLKWSK